MLRFYSFLVYFLLVVVGINADRRGYDKSSVGLHQSFSSQERALFGTGSSDDCILGPSMGYTPIHDLDEKVLPVRSQMTRTDDIHDERHHQQENLEEPKASFGRPPAFARQPWKKYMIYP
jgi:hypothetical protein